MGIAPERLSRVFDMFYQIDSSLERSQGGLGIGLSLVKSIVDLHAGSVQAVSAGLGKGSEFVLRLPALPVPRRQAQGAPRQELTRAKVARRVLVADDNRDAAESLSLLLEAAGHTVRVTYDGDQALSEAEAFRPEIALIDLGMPKVNGYEVCRRIRASEWGQSALLIAQTGWGQDEDKRRTRECGFDAHLVKPADPITVVKLVEQWSPRGTG